jgi:hypothetical protein
MKGVIVKTGESKSIVLLNNGRIAAIPTPVNCHEGMVVTVKYSILLKIIIITLAAALLIALGIFIGARFFNGRTETQMPMHRHMMEQRR